MKLWKSLSRILSGAAVLLFLLCVYCAAGTRLQVRIVQERIVPAQELPTLFTQVIEELSAGAHADSRFLPLPESRSPEDYALVELTLRAGSFGLLPCEWITAGVTPLPGDIALVRSSLPDIGPLGRAEERIYLLCEKHNAQTGHRAWITYYAFGIHMYKDALPAA